jgi:glycosyltransferase involved in cell wall biosynthesis/ubiquinone/menaquinone biosynthesis C-methylase UbiE
MIKKILILESTYLTKKPWGGSAKEAELIAHALTTGGYDVSIVKNTSFLKIFFNPPKADLIIGFGSPFFTGLVGLLGVRSKCPVWLYIDHLRYLREGFLEELRLVRESRPGFWERTLKIVEATKANFVNIWRDERFLLFSPSSCKIIFASEYLKKEVIKRVNLSKYSDLLVAYPIFPQDFRIKKNSERRNEKKLILYLGWLHYKRGVIDAVRAFSEISNEFGDLRLLIAGHPVQPETAHCLKMILSRDKKMSKRVKIMGKVSEEKLFSLINSASMVVFPFHSPFSVQPPLSLIEAMGQGKLVITTRVGAIHEIVTDGENGLLCKPRDIVGLRNKIKWALRHEDEAKILGKRARETIQKFSGRTLVDVILENLKEETEGWDPKKYYSKLNPSCYEEERFKGKAGRWIDYLEKRAFSDLDMFGSRCDSVVADVATGTGRMIEVLINNKVNKVVYGVDINKNMLALAKKKFKNQRKVKLLEGDVYNLPFRNEQIDKIFGGRIFMHIDKKDSFLKEIRRVLKPGGLLVFDFLNRNSLLSFLKLTPLRKRVWGLDLEEKFCSSKEIERLAKRAGYRVEETRSLLFFGETIYRKWPLLINFLGLIDSFLCKMPLFRRFPTKIVVVLRKVD